MKNYFLTCALAVLVVLTGVSLKRSMAGIGGSPIPPVPPSLAIGGSPIPPVPPSLGIGGSPIPPVPPSGSVSRKAR
jgi:hypothetical protein